MHVTIADRVARLEAKSEADDARLERELHVADGIHAGISAAITTLTAIVERHDTRMRALEVNAARILSGAGLVAVLYSILR